MPPNTPANPPTRSAAMGQPPAAGAGDGRPAVLDRLAKVARTASCTLYLDEGPLVAQVQALTALADLSASQERTRPGRLAQVRSNVRAQGGGAREETHAAEEVIAADADAVDAAKATVAAAETAAAAVTVTFTFRSLGRTRWRQAVQSNPPTDEDRAEWAGQGQTSEPPYHFEGVLAYVLEHALTSPRLSPAAITDILTGDAWNDSEVSLLWVTALEAQTQARQQIPPPS